MDIKDIEIGQTIIHGTTTDGLRIITPSRVTKTNNGCNMNIVGTLCRVSEIVSNPEEVAVMISEAINEKMGWPCIEDNSDE